MKNAMNYLIEPLLTQFFLIDAICRDFINEEERRKLFRGLARVFCIPMTDEVKRYFNASNSEQYKKITDYVFYERLCRTIEFAEACGQDVDISDMDRVLLAQKREALSIKAEIFKQGRNLTKDIISSTLLETAMNGNVDAMVTLAYMEYNGICVPKDTISALKRVRLCAKWNHLFGNLMGISYDKGHKKEYYNTLYTILQSVSQRAAFKYICEFTAYSEKCEKNVIAKIIEKAFCLEVVKRNAYDRMFSKVAFSELISIEDKEKMLLNKKNDAWMSLSMIPVDLDCESCLHFEKSVASDVILRREEELQKIFCSISPALNNRGKLYRTLLVAGDDAYVSDMYMEALKRGFSKMENVIEVDAGMLTMQDFVAAKEHFILRGLTETKKSKTVFLIKNCNELREAEQGELLKLLDYEYRRRFKLLEPTVSLDLSDVLIVLFATESNETVKKLADECDVVWTERIAEEEKDMVIQSVFATRVKSFGCEGVEMDDECRKYLATLETKEIARLIDGALKKVTYERETMITADSMRAFTRRQGGCKREREFGYLGGVFHEEY